MEGVDLTRQKSDARIAQLQKRMVIVSGMADRTSDPDERACLSEILRDCAGELERMDGIVGACDTVSRGISGVGAGDPARGGARGNLLTMMARFATVALAERIPRGPGEPTVRHEPRGLITKSCRNRKAS